MKVGTLVLLVFGIITFSIAFYFTCATFIKDYREMIILRSSVMNTIELTQRNRITTTRVSPESNIEIPELPIPLVEGIKINDETEDLEVIQVD